MIKILKYSPLVFDNILDPAILKLNVLDYDITILQNTTQQGCKQRIQIQQLKRQTQFLGRVMLPEAGLILKIGQ